MTLAKLNIDGLCNTKVAVDILLLNEVSNNIDVSSLELGYLGRGLDSVFFC
jgi:hypothetical protein